jgi:transcription termination/antitermination protein NusG
MVDNITNEQTQVQAQESSENPVEKTEKKWYVIYVTPGEETQVMKTLRDRATLARLEDKFGEIVVPTEEVVELKGGQKRKSERKIFPGYVLVNMIMDEHTWHLVRNIRKVRGFVGGTNENPAPLSDREVNEILQRVQEGAEKPKPKILFAPGEVVRIIEGPFADFDGVVEDVNYEKNKLKVSVLIFGRSTPVELDFSQVQKA